MVNSTTEKRQQQQQQQQQNDIQIKALQTLITNIGNNKLPTSQTLPLAQRILSSSISQTATVGSGIGAKHDKLTSISSSSSSLSPSFLKKIQRYYLKNNNNDNDDDNAVSHEKNQEEEIKHMISNVQSLYQTFMHDQQQTNADINGGHNDNIRIMNDTLKVLSRLTGSGSGMNNYNYNNSGGGGGGGGGDENRVWNKGFDSATNTTTNTQTIENQQQQEEESMSPPMKSNMNQDNEKNQVIASTTNSADNGNGTGTGTSPTFITSTPKTATANNVHRSYKHVQLAIQHEEQMILRECIHALQHIDGNILSFNSTAPSSSYSSPTTINSTCNTNKKDSHYNEMTETQNTIQNNLQSIQIQNGLLPFTIDSKQKVQYKHCRLISSGSLDVLHLCCEAGWLYSRIVNYIDFVMKKNENHYGEDDENKNNGGGGIIPRALASTFMNELQSYHSLLNTLETRLLTKELTSRQLMIQLRSSSSSSSSIPQLRTMAMIVDGIDPTLNGGQLLTALYLHSIHGDGRHVDLVQRVLYNASLPWYDMLYDWCINGVLRTNNATALPYSSLENSSSSKNEFFIQKVSSSRNKRNMGSTTKNDDDDDDDVWHGKFILDQNQIPYLPSLGGGKNGGLLSEALANEILIVGKGINFIRQCLHDTQWTLDVQRLLPQREWDSFTESMKDRKEQSAASPCSTSSATSAVTNQQELFQEIKKILGFHYNCTLTRKDLSGQCGEIINQSPLQRTVATAAQQVHQHILTSLFEDHHLLEHLRGLKEIMFLGQGDFICALMDGMKVEFERCGGGTSGIYMHNMIGILHEAFRSTNAKFLPDFVLQRVRINLASSSEKTNHKFWINDGADTMELDGWEICSLGYDIQAPLTAVVHNNAMKKYHEVFDLLFRLKRIEWMLNSTWKQSTVLNHAVQIMISKYGDVALGSSSSVKRGHDITRMKRLLRTFSMTRQTMIHFVSNLQSYLMFEVLESGWEALVSQLRNSKTLDEVIAAHDKYLDEIMVKSLLATLNRKGKNGNDGLGTQLRKVLSIAYRFCTIHEHIFSEAILSIDNASEKRRGAEYRSKAGNWGFDSTDPDIEGRSFYKLSDDANLKEIMSISQNFDSSLRSLLSMLNDEVNGASTVRIMSSPFNSPLAKEADESIIENDDSLRFLTFRLDFSDFYSARI